MDNPGFTAFDHPINQVEIPPGWQNPHSLLAGKPTALREMPDQIDGGLERSPDVASALQVLVAEIVDDRFKIAVRTRRKANPS